MTRQIKFRVWNGKEILPAQSINWNNEAWYESKDGSMGNIFIDDLKTALMQFTGLKDKNGKEIYEGDICKVYRGKICQVLFEAPIFCLKILNDKSDFRYQADTTFRDSDVLGNIYENPELLEGK